MPKKKSWLSLLKRFFITETRSKTEKEKKSRWLFQRLKTKRLASIAPPPSPAKETAHDEAEDEQSNNALNLPIATAPAAAEAAVAAAQSTTCKSDERTQDFLAIKIQCGDIQSNHQCEKEIQQLAAIKIQTAFRGYLARKALRALKGLVKLQAIIRGRAVRRQAITTLKCLQSIVSIQSQIRARRAQMAEEPCQYHDEKQLQELRDKVIKMESNDERRWDDSILSKEEANTLFFSKKEAAMKRERIREYSVIHRKSAESEPDKVNGKLRYWLEHWVDTQLAKRDDMKDLDSLLFSNPRSKDYERKQLNARKSQKQYRIEGIVSPISIPRRSFHHKKQGSIGDDNSLPGSPAILPTYMAATASAKAKTRSSSSPRLRQGSFDAYSEGASPYKNKLSLVSSMASEVISRSRSGKFDGFHQRSPSLKGIPGPIKSSRTLKDLSLDSECSLLNWDRHSSFR